MQKVLKAGVILIVKGLHEPEVLLIYREIHRDWTFPKGHCEAGESLEETAIRETKEETGLDVTLIRRLPDMEYVKPDGEEVKEGIFLGALTHEAQQERPEYPMDRIERVPLSKVEERLSYQNLKEYFRAVKETI